MLLLMIGVAVHQSQRSAGIVNVWCIVLLVIVGGIIVAVPGGRAVLFGGSFVVDDYARFLKLLAITGSAGALMLSMDYLRVNKQQQFEYGVLFLLSTLGMMMLISANDLIALYLGLELMSLPLYVVAAINRDSIRSTEAGLKYFVLGALSSGMLLYGASLIYGFTGTVGFCRHRQGNRQWRDHRPWCSGWCFCSSASASRFPPCRSTCGRPTCMRARRRR